MHCYSTTTRYKVLSYLYLDDLVLDCICKYIYKALARKRQNVVDLNVTVVTVLVQRVWEGRVGFRFIVRTHSYTNY